MRLASQTGQVNPLRWGAASIRHLYVIAGIDAAERRGWRPTDNDLAKCEDPRSGGVHHGRRRLMSEVRHRFHEEMRDLEDAIQRTGAEAQSLLEKGVRALAGGRPELCDEVITGDDVVDRLYLDIERRIVKLFALQTRSHPTCGC